MRLPIVLLVALLSASLAVVFATPASAAVTSSLQGTTLTLTGDGADDTIALGVSGTDLTVDLNADGVPDATFPLASLTSVIVNAGGGNDVVTASQRAPPATRDQRRGRGGRPDRRRRERHDLRR